MFAIGPLILTFAKGPRFEADADVESDHWYASGIISETARTIKENPAMEPAPGDGGCYA